MPSLHELEMRAEVEHNRLDVAEDFAWGVAVLCAVVAYLKWQAPWYLLVLLVPAVYFALTHRYRKLDRIATDTYHQVAGMEKYSQGREPPDAA